MSILILLERTKFNQFIGMYKDILDYIVLITAWKLKLTINNCTKNFYETSPS